MNEQLTTLLQYWGTIEEFKSWLEEGDNRLNVGSRIVWIHTQPDYDEGSETAPHSEEGAIFANGCFYKISQCNLTAEAIAELISEESNVSVEVVDGKLVITAEGGGAMTEQIKAATTVGYLTKDTVIPVGTTLQDLADMIFNPELGVKAGSKSATLTNAGTAAGTYEVGTVVTPDLGVKNVNLPQFVAVDAWGADQESGCAQTGVVYKRGTTNLSGTTDSYTLTEGSVTYSGVVSYSASTETPVSNKGNELETTIPAGTISTTGNVTYTGKYKYFYGNCDDPEALNEEGIRDLEKSGFITKDGTTSIGLDEFGPSTYAVFAVPSKYEVTAKDEMGLGFLLWTIDPFTVTYGSTTYTVYSKKNDNDENIRYSEITISKKN